MKRTVIPAFLLGTLALLGSSAASAQDTILAHTVKVTDSAVWFSQASQPDVVLYFPFAQCVVDPQLQIPNSRQRFRVASELGRPEIPDDLGELFPAWTGRVARPYRVTGTQSCTLDRAEDMSLVVQQIDLADRELAGNNDGLPLCQWSFNLPADAPPEQAERITQQILSGELFSVPLELQFAINDPVTWTMLYQVMRDTENIDKISDNSDNIDFLMLTSLLFITKSRATTDLPWWNHPEIATFFDQLREVYFAKDGETFKLRDPMPEGFELDMPALPLSILDVASCGVRTEDRARASEHMLGVQR